MRSLLIAGIYCLALIGDKGFDAGWLRVKALGVSGVHARR
jgi:hypothetical protein